MNPLDTALRTSMTAAQLQPLLRKELKAMDSQIPLGRLVTMHELVDGELARPRFQAILVILFAIFTTTLATLGIYGVISQNVRHRIPEFGLRRALGATPQDLLKLILRGGLKAPLTGLAIGLATAATTTGPILGSFLYEVCPREPLVFATVAATLAIAILAATTIPAREAMGLEPLTALRRD